MRFSQRQKRSRTDALCRSSVADQGDSWADASFEQS
jgi:hypothetical protein